MNPATLPSSVLKQRKAAVTMYCSRIRGFNVEPVHSLAVTGGNTTRFCGSGQFDAISTLALNEAPNLPLDFLAESWNGSDPSTDQTGYSISSSNGLENILKYTY